LLDQRTIDLAIAFQQSGYQRESLQFIRRAQVQKNIFQQQVLREGMHQDDRDSGSPQAIDNHSAECVKIL